METVSTSSRHERFTRAWSDAVASTILLDLPGPDLTAALRPYTERLAAAFAAPADEAHRIAHDVGRDFAAAGFTGAETLGRTLTHVATQAGLLLAETRGDPGERVAGVCGALAAGHVRGGRDRSRDGEREARRQAELARRTGEGRFRAVFERSALGIAVVDRSGRLLEVNAALAQMLGYAGRVPYHVRAPEVVHPDHREEIRSRWAALAEAGGGGHFRTEARFIRGDGEVIWGNLTVSLVPDTDGGPGYYVGMLEDVTERRALHSRLAFTAAHDPLTGLANRDLFFSWLDHAFTRSDSRVGLCFLDLDRFKAVNDTLGHVVGDELLVEVARRLRACLPGPDPCLARMGGDEFVLLVPDSPGPDHLVDLAERVLAAVAEPVRSRGHELSVTVSIGIVERPVAGTDPNDLMAAADTTLNWAKAAGKNRWVLFDEERNARELARSSLSATMRDGIDSGQFRLAYQPIVDLADGEVAGLEALVRWDHPRFGRLTPRDFVPVAEETGLIVPLGRWVLAEACRQARSWPEPERGRWFVSVNLAVRELHEPGVADDILATLAASGLAPRQLQLEVTESTFMATGSEAVDALRRLSAAGVRIAIDDFGTGYSNLAYLRSLPVAELKLAGPFVEGLRSGPAPVDERILGGLVRLAHGLRLTVTAESVETGRQAGRLRALGCDCAQGRFLAAPMDPAELARWVAQGAARERLAAVARPEIAAAPVTLGEPAGPAARTATG